MKSPRNFIGGIPDENVIQAVGDIERLFVTFRNQPLAGFPLFSLENAVHVLMFMLPEKMLTDIDNFNTKDNAQALDDIYDGFLLYAAYIIMDMHSILIADRDNAIGAIDAFADDLYEMLALFPTWDSIELVWK